MPAPGVTYLAECYGWIDRFSWRLVELDRQRACAGLLQAVGIGMAEGMNSLRAPSEHPGWLNAYRVPRTKFDAAMQALLDFSSRVRRDGRHAKMVAALDGGATIGQIRHWRAGRRRVPQWADDLLQTKIARRHSALDRHLKNKTAGD